MDWCPLPLGEDRLTFFVMEPFDEQGNLGHLSTIQDVLAIVTNFWLSEFRDRNLPSPFA
jgi:hypothetical protein